MMYGGIEAGGTKFVCAVANEQLEVVERLSIPTTTPEETMSHVQLFFDQFKLKAIGIGSFGPIDIKPESETYGYITQTPKISWQNFDFVGALKRRYRVPIAWTTDVNAAAFGEWQSGAARGLDSCLYLTVGTGVGGGAIMGGRLLEGFSHPEMGHLTIRRHERERLSGHCPFHHDCLEGLVAGPAIEKRCGIKAEDLGQEAEEWELIADYLAQALMSYTLILSPEKLILGGGVMKQSHLFPLIRQKYHDYLAEYVSIPDLDTYIVPCQLGDEAGITGCLLLAKKEWQTN